MMNKAILALATGEIFEGTSCGVSGTSVGELVFNTSIGGYQEIITDPSYCKQIVTFTYPHIGNVGTNKEDNESNKSWLEGIVIRDMPAVSSNWRSTQSFKTFLTEQNIVAISDVDTRHLTHLLRQNGAQNACITTELNAEEALNRAKSFSGLEGLNLVSTVTTPTAYEFQSNRGEWGGGRSLLLISMLLLMILVLSTIFYVCWLKVVPESPSCLQPHQQMRS
jgi:carbamoyl-phosphate synthase small subunit